MAKKSRATFQKREKERARQQKQKDKEQRRLEAKERRAGNAPHVAGEDPSIAGLHLEPQVLPAQWHDATPTDAATGLLQSTGGASSHAPINGTRTGTKLTPRVRADTPAGETRQDQ